ncbi:MAG: NAD-dependent dihydropyrimidine dehydrogenase subunit PreA [Candidatus Cloacimonetes bacterium]|nr:NAD-dependent dihydropyrimidine dehydrogenase subunit PreA [Candidatus Cloacimonadota bacterium]
MSFRKDLSIDFLGIRCENPFFLSSSPVASSYDMCAKAFETGWGGVVYKTIGNFIPKECSPRSDAIGKEGTPWIGFKNMEMISDKKPEQNFEYIYRLKHDYPHKIVIASIMGENEEDWKKLAIMSEQSGADMIECNFSCPQMTTKAMGSDVGQSPELVRRYCEITSNACNLPVIAKMTPNTGQIEIVAEAAIQGGAMGISAINTVKSVTGIDLNSFAGKPVIAGKSSISGYSGAAIKPIALRFITQLKQYHALKEVEISGIGGIETWIDALEFLLLGCRNVQVTTSVMQYGYRIVEDLISGLSYFMEEKGYNSLDDFIGKALSGIVPAEQIDRSFKILPEIDLNKCIGCGRCYISCYDGAHQAIDWDAEKRRPTINENCVGCHLCINICPVEGCIVPGEKVFLERK